jgi:Putative auto-transporter adhesin, head GIN domain
MRHFPLHIGLPFVALTLLAACGAADAKKADGDSGPQATRSYAERDFTGVVLASSDDVRVVQGNAFSVVATGSEKVLETLKITVEDGKLRIGRKRDGNWKIFSTNWNDKSAKIVVTLPVLNDAVLAGSGDMQIDTTATDRFKATLAGSGDLDVATVKAAAVELTLAGSGNLRAGNAAAASLEATIAGSGDLQVSGTAQKAELNVAGSGDIDASGLTATFADASIAGSGNISVRATGKAEGSIVGSGDIEVAGTKDCAITKRGSGEVTCKG